VTSTSKARKRAPKKAILHVAVVMSRTRGSFGRPAGGDWASFVDADRNAVIGKALSASQSWGCASRYDVVVGTLDTVIELPTVYKEAPLR